MRPNSGVTLLELLIVVAIVGILGVVAVAALPNDRLAVNQTARGFAQQFSRARLEAIRSNAFAGVTISTAGDGGYTVCVDTSGDRQCSASEAIQSIAMGQGTNAKVRLTVTPFASFIFDPRGIPFSPVSGNVTFTNMSGTYSVTVAVTAAGRASVL